MSTKLIDITKQLTTFLGSPAQSILLKESNGISGISLIEAHIQKRRLETGRAGMIQLSECCGTGINCLNIVHVAVAERNRRKGLFSDFLELLERFDYGDYLDSATDVYVRIDKVMNPILDEYLPKKGYARLRSGDETHYSYHKIIRQRKDSHSNPTQEANIGLDLTAIQTSRNHDGSYSDR
ncbi:MAG: hypothetical protein EG824_02550 [Deltaproteobacteria bacterium]|nr:hypothetical protein [Deltaproteobacteria bacterium]